MSLCHLTKVSGTEEAGGLFYTAFWILSNSNDVSAKHNHVGWKQEDFSEMSAEEGSAFPTGRTDKLL